MDTKEPVLAHTSVQHLLTAHLVNPLGIDERRPILSWQIASPERYVLQSAYQVQVASSVSQLDHSDGLLWDSGKIAAIPAPSIPYGGPELQSRQRCYWRVRVWDQEGRASDWSEPA